MLHYDAPGVAVATRSQQLHTGASPDTATEIELSLDACASLQHCYTALKHSRRQLRSAAQQRQPPHNHNDERRRGKDDRRERRKQAEVDLTLDNISIVPDSLCMACGGSGETRIMLTKIPLFREVLLSSFACPHCGERNTEVQFGGETQPKGCRMAVTCSGREDLDRQVVKSESCKVLVPDLELEIPAATQRGVVTTVEGVLTRAADELAALQPQRLVADVEIGRKVQRVIDALRDRANGDFDPFQLIVDDPAGNSFVQPLHQPDGALTTTHYERGRGRHRSGISARRVAHVADGTTETASKTLEGVDNMLATPSGGTGGHDLRRGLPPLQSARRGADVRREDSVLQGVRHHVLFVRGCGYRNAEVKGGGAVPLKGCRAVAEVCRRGRLVEGRAEVRYGGRDDPGAGPGARARHVRFGPV